MDTLILQYSRGNIGKLKNSQFDGSIHYSYLFNMKTENRMRKKDQPKQYSCRSKDSQFKSKIEPWVTSVFDAPSAKSQLFQTPGLFFLNGIFLRNESSIGESRQHWAGVCLGPIVFFQKIWKEKSWTFYMKLRKWFLNLMKLDVPSLKKIDLIFKIQK